MIFPDDAPSSLENIVTINGTDIIVSSYADYNVFGTYTVEVLLYFKDCTETSASDYFILEIICDSTNSPITLGNFTSDPFVTDIFYSPQSINSTYSHYRCLPPVVTFKDGNGNSLDWISGSLEND